MDVGLCLADPNLGRGGPRPLGQGPRPARLGRPAGVLITLDVCGIDRELSGRIRDTLQSATAGPTGRAGLFAHPLRAGRRRQPADHVQDRRRRARRIAEYAQTSEDRHRQGRPARPRAAPGRALTWGNGRCDFAVNRRANTGGRRPQAAGSPGAQGPDDHDVPVLRVTGRRSSAGGRLRLCLPLHGPGLLQVLRRLRRVCPGRARDATPGATGHVRSRLRHRSEPDPSTLARAGRAIRQAAGRERRERPRRADASRSTGRSNRYEEIPLAFASLPAASRSSATRSRPTSTSPAGPGISSKIDRKQGSLEPTYPYPVQAWRLDGLTWVFLGGEVVVDYSLRIKRNLGSSHTWVSAYCNDVMAYIPSKRVLKEGGYEGATAMVYYGLPSPWSDEVEESIIAAVVRVSNADQESGGSNRAARSLTASWLTCRETS